MLKQLFAQAPNLIRGFSFPFFFILLAFPTALVAQVQNLSGKVTNTNGLGIENVNVSLEGTSYGTVSDKQGNYTLNCRFVKKGKLIFSKVGFKRLHKAIRFANATDTKTVDVQMQLDYTPIPEVRVQEQRQSQSIQRIQVKYLQQLPTIDGGIESIIKTLPSVYSNNELSSQYSVRGGNFDENLVYVNGIQVYRPFLIRTGEQEGLSFINPDLVQSVYFSAGGFNPEYGDKMSSVLDITYKKPKKLAGSISGGLMGFSAHLESSMFGGKLKQISGFRYRNTALVLNSLETTGDYRPSYLDFQTYWTYQITKQLEINALGTLSQNQFLFVPSNLETQFGTKDQAQQLNIDFEGQEDDRYKTISGALELLYKPSLNTHLKLSGSIFRTYEQETYDLAGTYVISAQQEEETGQENLGDVIANLGLGRFINHGRNYLEAYVGHIGHSGKIITTHSTWEWGLRFQHETIRDKIHEWEMLDSAGYSLPPSGQGFDPTTSQTVEMSRSLFTNIDLSSQRLTAYAQNRYEFETNRFYAQSVAGARLSYWSYNKEWLVSPRANISLQPKANLDWNFRAAAGVYYQQPFYREMRNQQGELVDEVNAQRAIHLLVGGDYNFTMWGRPFRFTADLYYKILNNLVPYEIDNLRLRYFAGLRAKGYTAGLELKVNGEFVKGTDSWFSVSLMQSQEDVAGDQAGYIPRPTDQLFQAVVFFQDYFPNNDTWKVHLSGNYGTGLPFGPPNRERAAAVFRLPSYKRVDIGISKKLFHRSGKRMFKTFKSIWLSGEVYNLLGMRNTVSILWFRVVPNTAQLYNNFEQYGVPNRLTGRRLNLKITAKF